MVRVLVLACLLGGCFEDRYRCTSDRQCDVEGGRCETDGFCTKFDDDCPTGRRYQHAGAHGDACFDDRVVLKNACAGGQPPAMPEGCVADVCSLVPACCELAWTDACVQLAQEQCTDLRCDTRIAITAARGAVTELWDARFRDGEWTITKRTELAPPLAWVAPAPGQTEPRLAGTSGNSALVIGDVVVGTEIARTYTSITSIDFDRDGRDTIVVGHQSAIGGDPKIDIVKLPSGATRETSTVQTGANITWGDIDRDGFIDAVARTGAQYHYLPTFDGAEHERDLTTRVVVNGLGGGTDPAPQMRSVDWIDVDGDRLLDLVSFGSDVHVHTDPSGIRENPEIRIDCDPPSAATPLPCAPTFDGISFGGAAMPSKDGAKLVVAAFPGRKMYLGALDAGVMKLTPLPFKNDGCTCTYNVNQMRWDCSGCLPVVAVVVRDLDGDHALDIVAIDSRLNIYTALAGSSFTFIGPQPINTSLGPADGFFSINVSVSGARL
jgi:hypothetical protein